MPTLDELCATALAWRAGATTAAVVDGTAGSRPDVALALRRAGHAGELIIVDWLCSALEAHRHQYRDACARQGLAAEPARWLAADLLSLRLPGAWLLVCMTLPRWSRPGGVHKPRGPADGARLLRELAATGAQGLTALLTPVELDTLTAGAASLGWPVELGALGDCDGVTAGLVTVSCGRDSACPVIA
jgi:hypothetical protein